MKHEELPQPIPLGRSRDLKGQKFQKLTPLYKCRSLTKPDDTRRSYWACKCDCGEYTIVRSDHLITEHIKSCGCENSPNLIGKKFGKLTVLEEIRGSQKTPKKWKCQCECGKITNVPTSQLNSGHTKTCGTCFSGNDLTGQRFGKLIVLERTKTDKFGRWLWLCKCDCGTVKECLGASLTSGGIKSCGCLNSKGEFKIQQILMVNNINFETQKTFKNCLSEKGYSLRFDFYLPDYNCCIEYDGSHHYQATNSGWNTEKHVAQTQKNDAIKNQYCKDNNILLKRIPYLEYSNISFETIMDDTFVVI